MKKAILYIFFEANYQIIISDEIERYHKLRFSSNTTANRAYFISEDLARFIISVYGLKKDQGEYLHLSHNLKIRRDRWVQCMG